MIILGELPAIRWLSYSGPRRQNLLKDRNQKNKNIALRILTEVSTILSHGFFCSALTKNKFLIDLPLFRFVQPIAYAGKIIVVDHHTTARQNVVVTHLLCFDFIF